MQHNAWRTTHVLRYIDQMRHRSVEGHIDSAFQLHSRDCIMIEENVEYLFLCRTPLPLAVWGTVTGTRSMGLGRFRLNAQVIWWGSLTVGMVEWMVCSYHIECSYHIGRLVCRYHIGVATTQLWLDTTQLPLATTLISERGDCLSPTRVE